MKIQKSIRGHLFVIHGVGHIETWQPLYQSEGPAQVFLIILTWLIISIGDLSPEVQKEILLSYNTVF